MTLILEARPELESRLQEAAARRGLDASEYALRLLAESLAADDGELDVLLDAALGSFADVPFSSEDLHRERREDLEREEQRWQPRLGQPPSNGEPEQPARSSSMPAR